MSRLCNDYDQNKKALSSGVVRQASSRCILMSCQGCDPDIKLNHGGFIVKTGMSGLQMQPDIITCVLINPLSLIFLDICQDRRFFSFHTHKAHRQPIYSFQLVEQFVGT